MTPERLIAPARLASTAVLRGQTDDRLIDLTRAGNARAFEAIVHRYRGPLLKYCARIVPPERAEDAVQQTFLSAYNAISAGDRELNLRPWLYRIAHNSALNLLRQNGWNHEQLDENFDGVLRPDQAVEARERLASLVASVKGLPERQRDAIVLRELEGRSYEEIAGALGVTDGAVRQLLNRARTTLRAGATALTPYGLAERIATAASGRGSAVGERIAEICSGAGGALSMAKVGAAVLVAGAVATGGANHALPGVGGSSRHQVDSAAASTPSGGGAARTHGTPLIVARAPATTGHVDRRAGRGRRHDGERRVGSHRGRDERSGGEGSQPADDRSGSGDRSGRDSSGGGDRRSGSSSGSGGGSDEGTTTSSGDRSSDSSGPGPSAGSDGSDSSGPGDGGGTVTTTTTPTPTPTPTDDGGGGRH
jgi:RNA polymerase sigma factor (sigma-70 family)